jgi:carotenoid cleavage dioxygenase-like enzyme
MNAPNPSPYLLGNFAPVHDELDLRDLEVIDELPPALRGVFVRVGPNPQHPPRGRYHWFDGDGMVHSVSFTPAA